MNTNVTPFPLMRPLSCVLALLFGGCDAQSGVTNKSAPAASDVATSPAPLRSYSLTIIGYNYTDSGIGSFEVNGTGGGNIEVSIPEAGGSKAACCASLTTPPPSWRTVKIKWTRDGDTWCELDVPYPERIPIDAEYLEAHFYRDGHVEVAASAIDSPPRLRLERFHGNSRHADPSQNVNNDGKLARCHRGYS